MKNSTRSTQKEVLTLWPWNFNEKNFHSAIIFSNYSNWTFNLSLFNSAIKNEIGVFFATWTKNNVLFSSLAFDTFRGDNEQKMKSFWVFWRTSDILGLTKKIRGTNPVSLLHNEGLNIVINYDSTEKKAEQKFFVAHTIVILKLPPFLSHAAKKVIFFGPRS